MIMQANVTRSLALETLQNIRAAAESALQQGISTVPVTVLREHPPTGRNVLLCGHSGPVGEIMDAVPITYAGEEAWRVTGKFRAAKLILFCGKAIETILKAA